MSPPDPSQADEPRPPLVSLLLARLQVQWFALAMVGLFVAAWYFPRLPRAVNPGDWTKIGAIALIFLISGISLDTRQALRSMADWPVHLYIQGFNFVLIPAVVWLALLLFGRHMDEALVLGFYLLAAIPTTVTSCAVFTQLAGGNFAAALLNAVLGNVLGVFVSPALLLLLLGSSQTSIQLDTARTIRELATIVLLPLLVGQAVRFAWPAVVAQWKKAGSTVNRWCILLIIYLAFGQVFAAPSPGASLRAAVVPLALLLPAHLVLLWLVDAGARLLRLPREDRIAAVFCAPQKTLSLGLPMAAAVLAQKPEMMGMAVMPIIVYHPIQLLIGGVLEQRFRAGAVSLAAVDNADAG